MTSSTSWWREIHAWLSVSTSGLAFRSFTLQMALQQNGTGSEHNGETSNRGPSTDGNGEIQHERAERFAFTAEPTLEDIRRMQAEFTDERNWNQYHQPRNLLLALVGEVAEGLPDWSEPEREHLAQELSDVLIYLVELAEKCHVDLPQAVLRKVALNRLKYPASKVHGSAKKYTEYTD
uniref:dCTP pyrophosphatase 1 n=1 Tax=Cyprinus carpio carpio TaxID=630221 RepID=A0A9J7XW35_CYPCA